MLSFSWLIPLLPLAGFLLIQIFKTKLSARSSGFLASLIVGVSFLLSAGLFTSVDGSHSIHYFNWIQSSSLNIPFAVLIDPLSVVMLLIITGVGFLIHVYSIGYMADDDRAPQFFSYLNLFVFFMLVLVLADNYVLMFAGWEGVGLCSYLLIGFWFKNDSYNRAANKAFIMNRIGDLGFLLGLLLMFLTFGSLSFGAVFESASGFSANEPVIIAITLLLFIGATGKSAQLPLYTWLPDAMAGPTPVSALIHAATMVTAGIYMVVRSNILYSLSPATLDVIAVTGVATALFAATIALYQTDIKKVLAYSTVSQLGYMFVALGCGAFATGMFHVTTHAFFKALLFLAAGSVIHALSGEQDIRNMGALRKALPATFWVFLAGTLAISGVPPFAGFFSKDEVLAVAYVKSPLLFFILAVTSVLTAVYMFRLLFLTFFGKFRGTAEQKNHLHESPPSMIVPLVILAVLSTVGGFMGMPEIFGSRHFFSDYLQPIVSGYGIGETKPSHFFEYSLISISVVALAIIIYLVFRHYVSAGKTPSADGAPQSITSGLLRNKYYVDELYDAIIVKPMFAFSRFFHAVIDVKIIDRLVRSAGDLTVRSGKISARLQSGLVGSYILLMVIVITALFIYQFYWKG